MKKAVVLLTVLLVALRALAGMSNSLELTQLYIVGDATEHGWDLGAAPDMRRIAPGVFRWEGKLSAGAEFKFMNTREGWHKHIVATIPNVSTTAGGTYNLDFYADWALPADKDLKFKAPAEAGTYLITVDLNSLRMKVDEAPAELQMPARLYATGTALDGKFVELPPLGNVEFKGALELTPGNIVLVDRADLSSETRVFGPLFEDVDLCFGEGLHSGLVECGTSVRGWSVSVAGRYTLYVDLRGESVRGRMFKPRNRLFIVGGCCELSWNYWDESDCVFTPLQGSPEKLVWEGRLEIGRQEGPEPEKFKILTEKNWYAETYHPYCADEDAESSENFRASGGEDYKWTIRRNGNYRITVDTWRETLSIICQPDATIDNENDNAGVEARPEAAVSEGNVEVYDVWGHRLPHDSELVHGVYIVRKSGCPARKILK